MSSFESRIVRIDRRVLAAGAGVMLVALAGLIATPSQVWPAWLLAGQYVLGLALGSLFFIALMVVCGARWWDGLQCVPQALCRLLPWGAGMVLLAVTVGLPWIYGWTDTHAHHGQAGFRETWLQPGFFRLRALIYIAIWFAMIPALTRALRATPRRVGVAAATIVLFAVTFVLSTFDWIMSIDTHWFSTILGVYNFAGTFLSALAAIGVLTILHRGRRAGLVVSDDCLHDLGKLVHAFSVFWAYIWFSQYMLIWYSNLPEETSYYMLRHSPGWASLSLLNVALNWGVPFVVLLPRSAKRNPTTLLQVCVLLLVGRAVDLYWMLIPPFADRGPGIHAWSILLVLGAFTLTAALLRTRLAPQSEPQIPPTQVLLDPSGPPG